MENKTPKTPEKGNSFSISIEEKIYDILHNIQFNAEGLKEGDINHYVKKICSFFSTKYNLAEMCNKCIGHFLNGFSVDLYKDSIDAQGTIYLACEHEKTS